MKPGPGGEKLCQSDHSCHGDATLSCALGTKGDPPYQGVPGAPWDRRGYSTHNTQSAGSPQLSSGLPWEGA